MRRRQIAQMRAAKSPVSIPSLEELRQRYKAKFGKAPHWKMKAETILEKLNA